MNEKQQLPEPVRRALHEGLRMLGRVGNRAIGAALKSVAKDGREVAKEVDARLEKFTKGVDDLTRPGRRGE
jgi:hypothetical protein